MKIYYVKCLKYDKSFDSRNLTTYSLNLVIKGNKMKLHWLLITSATLYYGQIWASETLQDNPEISPKVKTAYAAALKQEDYKIDWSQFNFKDPKDDAEATQTYKLLDHFFIDVIQKTRDASALVSQRRN